MKNVNRITAILFIAMLIFSACQKDELITNEFSKASDGELSYLHHDHRNCGMDHSMEELLANPAEAQAYQERIRNFQQLSKAGGLTSEVTIPIAVHFRGVTNTTRAGLEKIVNEQLVALNRDFAASNTDKSKFTGKTSYFPGVSLGTSKIKFAMATKNHPAGYGLTEGQSAITINKTSGSKLTKFKGYLNVVVLGSNYDALGDAPLGGAGNGDIINISAAAFGVGSKSGNVQATAPFNKGRTLVHEVGHYFLLDHIWGNGCGVDDKVNDTPTQDGPNYGTPSYGKKSCNTNDLWLNYMDYVDDKNMVLFTKGQVLRMENYIKANLLSMVTKGSSVIGSGSGNTGGNGGSGGSGGNTGGGTTGKVDLEVKVKLDAYGSETKWWIKIKGTKTVVARGGRYEDGQRNKVFTQNMRLSPGDYQLVVVDKYGDGMCCTYGKGNVKIFTKADNKRIVLCNGRFGKYQKINFTIGNSGSRTTSEEADEPLDLPLKHIDVPTDNNQD